MLVSALAVQQRNCRKHSRHLLQKLQVKYLEDSNWYKLSNINLYNTVDVIE